MYTSTLFSVLVLLAGTTMSRPLPEEVTASASDSAAPSSSIYPSSAPTMESVPSSTTIASSATSSTSIGSASTTSSIQMSESSTPQYVLNWNDDDEESIVPSPSPTPSPTPSPVGTEAAASSKSPLVIKPYGGPAPTKTYASWAVAPTFSNMDTFSVSTFAAGTTNLAILRGSPVKYTFANETYTYANESQAMTQQGVDNTVDQAHSEPWDNSTNALQILYPQGSINPKSSPQGGSEFYAHPLDLKKATNTTLQYSVYFPHDFDFVKGGKLPGLYGGHKGCSGGDAAEDCFSTRMMWRAKGEGELYLYVPKDKQSPGLCSTPPKSVCESTYGLSIGRGAWTFAKGDWTTIRQDIWLNTPGVNDGGFNIWINGNLVLNANDVRYRENLNTCVKTDSSSEIPVNEEDFEDIATSTSASISSSSASSSSSTNAIISSISTTSSGSTSTPARSATILSKTSAASTGVTSKSLVVQSAAASTVTPSASSASARTGSGLTTSSRAASTLLIQSAGSPSASSILTTKASSSSAMTSPSASASSGLDPNAAPNLLQWFKRHDGEVTSSDASATSTASPSDSSSSASTDSSTSTDLSTSTDSPTSTVSSSSAAPSETSMASGGTPADAFQKEVTKSDSCAPVGFLGLFFSTFFGGHTAEWASPKDQHTYFKDFAMWVNEEAAV